MHDAKHHYRKLRKVTIITVANYKCNYNTSKPKFENEPQNVKKTVHRSSLHFKYIREHNKESPSLARCGLVIIPSRLNILSTGSTKRENSRRYQDQDHDSHFACKTETRPRLIMELSRDVSRRDLSLEDYIIL